MSEVPEQSWDGIIRRSIDVDVKAIDDEARSVEVVASTATIDAHGDVVEQKFDLKRYKKNPVVLWHHNRFGDSWLGGTSDPEDFLPIGRAEGTKIERDAAGNRQLIAKIFFGSKDYNELAEKIWLGFREKIIRAVSIGFRPGKVTEELDDHGHAFFRLSDNELFELSVVPIGSNPDAVAKSIAFERQHLRRLAAPVAPEPEREREDMDIKEIQGQLDAVKGELAVAKSELEKSASENERANTRVKELEEQAEGLKLKATELTEQVKQLTEQNQEYAKAEEAAEKAAAEAQVDDLVGKKIAPAAREKWLAVRLRSKDEFDSLIEDMPDMPHLKNVTPSAPIGGDNGVSLIEEAKSA